MDKEIKETSTKSNHNLQEEKSMLYERELNPNYKKQPVVHSDTSGPSYDAQWLQKALQRASEQAEEQGKTLEEIAAQRWGSLEKFYTLLDAAKTKCNSNEGRSSHREVDHKRKNDNSSKYGGNERESREYSRERNCHDKDRDRSYKDKYNSDKFKRRREDGKYGFETTEKRRNRNEVDENKGWKYRDRGIEQCEKRSCRSKSRSQSPGQRIDHSASKKFRYLNPEGSNERTKPVSLPTFPSSSRSSGWRKKVNVENEEKLPNTQKQVMNFNKLIESENLPSVDFDATEKDHQKEKRNICDEIKDKSKPLNEESNKPLTKSQMNKLAAKLTKAELTNNLALVNKLKAKLEKARLLYNEIEDGRNKDDVEEIVILTGKQAKVSHKSKSASDQRRRFESSKELQSMFVEAKTSTSKDEQELYETEAVRHLQQLDDDFATESLPSKAFQRDTANRDKHRAIKEHQHQQHIAETCEWCVQSSSMQKHLIVTLGKKCYISVPKYTSLEEGQCYIVTQEHITCSTQAEEDVWQEVMLYRQALLQLFRSQGKDCVFFELVLNMSSSHMVIHCIPMPQDVADLAPIYFKKALQDCDDEWSSNKKVVDLKGKDVRSAVPKELPYFFVDFGLNPGYAHVIENKKLFPNYFGQEIVGGMLDKDAYLWRKPPKESFESQSKKVVEFSKNFQKFEPNT